MHPAVSRICGLAARACFAMCLHLGSTVARIAVVCCADLYGSLPWTDHCFCHHIGSLLAQFSFVDRCFGGLILPILCPALPNPHRKWFMVGIGSGKFLHLSSFSLTVPVGGCLQGWFLLPGLPWNLPAVPGICTGPPPTLYGTSSQARQLAMSLIF